MALGYVPQVIISPPRIHLVGGGRGEANPSSREAKPGRNPARKSVRARASRYTGLDRVPPDLTAQRAGKVLKWLRFKIRELLSQSLQSFHIDLSTFLRRTVWAGHKVLHGIRRTLQQRNVLVLLRLQPFPVPV